ncbi:MAG: hypothetical protein NC336_06365 [Clostridium sp.]|nr:hypothetical protein [Clostridium sp.]
MEQKIIKYGIRAAIMAVLYIAISIAFDLTFDNKITGFAGTVVEAVIFGIVYVAIFGIIHNRKRQ